MTDLYYVIYSRGKGYLGPCGSFGAYDQAERHPTPDKGYSASIQRHIAPDARWVGPCAEGEEP